jgi:6-pyruvoyltetrahydropterin/6-carboxytetrahydropterin synthase
MKLELVRRYRFEAARWLPLLPPEHPCSRLHGHGFRVEVRLQGAIDPATGFVLDYADLDAHVLPLVGQLDHACLNHLGRDHNEPLLQNPTTEHIAQWLLQHLQVLVPQVYSVAVWETENAGAVAYAS